MARDTARKLFARYNHYVLAVLTVALVLHYEYIDSSEATPLILAGLGALVGLVYSGHEIIKAINA